jgi:hypothetical protein
MKEQSMTHSNVVKITSKFGTERWGKRYNYSPVTKAPPRTKRLKKHLKSQNQITYAFTATTLRQIACSSPTPQKLTKRTLKLISQKTPFALLIHKMAETMRLYKPTHPCPPSLLAAVAAHASKLKLCLKPTPPDRIIVATLASLLTTGLEAQGVVVYPALPWFATNMPPLTLYAQVENIQCRAMSACTRAIKQSTFQHSGIVASLVFQPPVSNNS